MLMKCYSRDKILNLIMWVSFINFSRALDIIAIRSPGPKHIKKQESALRRKRLYLLFFSFAYNQFNKPGGISFHRNLLQSCA